jgi:hypothetical protein
MMTPSVLIHSKYRALNSPIDGWDDAEGLGCGRCVGDQHTVEHVVAGLGDHVQYEDHDGEHQEISVADDERERVAACQGFVHRLRLAGLPKHGFAPMHEVGEPQTRDQEGRRNQHEKKRRTVTNEGLGDARARDRPNRAADADDGKETLALLLGVRLGREALELRHGHGVEDSGPQEKRDAQRDAAGPQSPDHPAERLARDLQQVIRGQEEEDVEGEKQRRRGLPGRTSAKIPRRNSTGCSRKRGRIASGWLEAAIRGRGIARRPRGSLAPVAVDPPSRRSIQRRGG